MLTREQISGLLNRSWNGNGPILSVYLDVDQGKARNLNRGYLAALKSLEKEIVYSPPNRETKDAWQRTLKRVHELVENLDVHGKSAVFIGREDDFWHEQVPAPLHEAAYAGCVPYVRHLIEALDEYGRYGIVLTDRAHSRIYTFHLRSLELSETWVATDPVNRAAAAGRDQMWSQASNQRRAEEHARAHMKEVTGEVQRLIREQGLQRIVLAGPPEGVAELKHEFDEQTQSRVIGQLSLPVDAPVEDIRQAARNVVEGHEREEESALVDALLGAASNGGKGVIGPEATAKAASQAKIGTLAYTAAPDWDEAAIEAARDALAAVTAKPVSASPKEVLECFVQQVWSTGGTVEEVRGEAAELLNHKAHGIGGVLRFS